jgi:hypothetical protein
MSAMDILRRLERGEAYLGDFLSENDFVDVMFAARWRIIRVFVNARSGPGRRATPGYVMGCDDKLTSLATYLQLVMSPAVQSKIYAASSLPTGCGSLGPKMQQFVVSHVRFELYIRVLEEMREANELWYMDGEWTVPQSVMDEYLLRVKRAKATYRNQRCFHGRRPNRDRSRMRQLRVATGTSTGM